MNIFCILLTVLTEIKFVYGICYTTFIYGITTTGLRALFGFANIGHSTGHGAGELIMILSILVKLKFNFLI